MPPFPDFGAPPRRSRLTILGLGLVALGWGALVADIVFADALLKAGSLVAVLSLKGDIATLAETLIATGFGFALMGGLAQGFGALNRFFDAVLQRSTAPRPAPPPEPPVEAEVVVAPAVERAASPGGPARERNYVIRPDGSVEVDTLLGTRVFATLDEARDFIR